MSMTTLMRQACDQEVVSLLTKNAIHPIIDIGSPGFVSPLFVKPKMSGGYRPLRAL